MNEDLMLNFVKKCRSFLSVCKTVDGMEHICVPHGGKCKRSIEFCQTTYGNYSRWMHNAPDVSWNKRFKA